MSFFRSIEKLRNKSEQDRRTISLVSASVVFSLVFFVWLTTFQLRSEKVENAEVYNELSPVASLKNMSSRFFADIKEGLNFNKNDDTAESVSQSQTETAATHTATTNISDENIIGTTTEGNFLGNEIGDEVLFGTSSDMTSATSSEGSGEANPASAESLPEGGQDPT